MVSPLASTPTKILFSPYNVYRTFVQSCLVLEKLTTCSCSNFVHSTPSLLFPCRKVWPISPTSTESLANRYCSWKKSDQSHLIPYKHWPITPILTKQFHRKSEQNPTKLWWIQPTPKETLPSLPVPTKSLTKPYFSQRKFDQFFPSPQNFWLVLQIAWPKTYSSLQKGWPILPILSLLKVWPILPILAERLSYSAHFWRKCDQAFCPCWKFDQSLLLLQKV